MISENINSKKQKICIIGAGYIGAVIAAVLAEKGNFVYAVDINSEILKALNEGKSHINEPGLDKLIKKVVKTGNLLATNDFSVVNNSDVIVVTVGTPLQNDGTADKSAIKSVVKRISPFIKDNQLIIIKSTVPPFTTQEDVANPLRKIANVNVAFCPERLAEGNAIEECKTIPVVVGGIDNRSGKKAKEFWENNLGVECIEVENACSAELVKLANNAWIDLNIALSFELAKLSDKLNIDVLQVIEAANSLPKGKNFVNILTPSIGVGGYCLTKDPWFLNAFAESFGSKFETAITSRKINQGSPIYSAQTIQRLIESNFSYCKKSDIQIGIMGLAFKNNTGDCRFTPTIKLIEFLSLKGFSLKIFDPYISKEDYKLFDFKNVKVIKDQKEIMKGSHCIAFLAGHREFHEITIDDFKNNLVEGSIIFDGRMYFSREKINEFSESGFVYKGVGR